MLPDDHAARKAALAERRAKLSAEKQSLLERRAKGEPTGAAKTRASSLVLVQAGDATRTPLFFVHPAVGDVLCYADLARHLGPEQPFYGLQARGLHGEAEPLASVEEMASYYLTLVRMVQPQGPYRLGGWSLGGLVAFEMAQQFLALGERAALLALVDCGGTPGNQNAEPDDLRLLAGLAQGMGLSLDQIAVDPEQLRRLPLDAQLAQLLELAKTAGAVPAEMDLAQTREVFKVFKNNVYALRRYVPRPYSGSIALFKAREQIGEAEPDLGWRAWCQDVQVREVPGGHYTMVREPNVQVLAAQLGNELRRIEMGEVSA